MTASVLLIPDFSLQAVLRHEPELHAQPVALIDAGTNKGTVLQRTGCAAASGICPGITSTQAMARCSRIILRPRNRTQESAANAILLHCAYGASSHIEATADGICTMDLKGIPFWKNAASADSGAVVNRQEAFCRALLDQLVQFHLTARIGVAANPLLALHAARAAATAAFLIVRDSKTFRDQLPIESLAS